MRQRKPDVQRYRAAASQVLVMSCCGSGHLGSRNDEAGVGRHWAGCTSIDEGAARGTVEAPSLPTAPAMTNACLRWIEPWRDCQSACSDWSMAVLAPL